jgi:hypothetical protein
MDNGSVCMYLQNGERRTHGHLQNTTAVTCAQKLASFTWKELSSRLGA